MSGIAGIAGPGKVGEVTAMLAAMAHRGSAGFHAIETEGVCLGAVAASGSKAAWDASGALVRDETGPGHFARAQARNGQFELQRDRLGVAPLYYGRTADGCLCFASEAKVLLAHTDQIQELPPGAILDGDRLMPGKPLTVQPPLDRPPGDLATLLRSKLEAVVTRCVSAGKVGSWLSGGLDSSALVALARPSAGRLHTFAGGLAGASDLDYAREVAAHVGSVHHEVVLTLETLKAGLPDVVAALESFDALLIRSSVVNFAVGKAASGEVDAALSGEGGDELFGGYAYLKAFSMAALPGELADITNRLHNTALQRVDRCAAAHGLTAHVCFLDPEVVELAFQIPAEYKIRGGVEKWILRRALEGTLPERVLERPKAKFWEGAGVRGLLAEVAETQVSDADFSHQGRLPNGWQLNSKEELMYYRLFRERFGDRRDLAWMGRTQNVSGVN